MRLNSASTGETSWSIPVHCEDPGTCADAYACVDVDVVAGSGANTLDVPIPPALAVTPPGDAGVLGVVLLYGGLACDAGLAPAVPVPPPFPPPAGMVDPTTADEAAVNPGIGRTHIFSRSLLCRSRSSSMRRKMSFRENEEEGGAGRLRDVEGRSGRRGAEAELMEGSVGWSEEEVRRG